MCITVLDIESVSLLTSVDLLTLKTDKTVTFHGKASSLSAQIGKEKMFITCPRKVSSISGA